MMDIPKEISYKIIKYACGADNCASKRTMIDKRALIYMMIDKHMYDYVQPLFRDFLRCMYVRRGRSLIRGSSYWYGLGCLLVGEILGPSIVCEHYCLPLSIYIQATPRATGGHIGAPVYEICGMVIKVGCKHVHFRRIDDGYKWSSHVNRSDKPYVLGFLHKYFREIYNIIIWK